MSDEKLERLRQKNPGNPWLEMAGIFKDDPLFDDMLAYIEKNTIVNWMRRML